MLVYSQSESEEGKEWGSSEGEGKQERGVRGGRMEGYASNKRGPATSSR